MADEWKNDDGQQGENAQQQNATPSDRQGQQSESAQDGQQSLADRQDSEQLVDELEQGDADTMTQPDESSGVSGAEGSFGQSSADSTGPDEELQNPDPQSDFAERDALTQETDNGMGEAGR